MASDVTKETIQALAAANGLHLPENRLDRVLKQYQSFLRLTDRLNAYDLKMDAEPSTVFTLTAEVPDSPSARKSAAAPSQQKKGGSRGNR